MLQPIHQQLPEDRFLAEAGAEGHGETEQLEERRREQVGANGRQAGSERDERRGGCERKQPSEDRRAARRESGVCEKSPCAHVPSVVAMPRRIIAALRSSLPIR